MQAGVSVLGGILGSLLGRKTTASVITRGSSAIGRATSAYKQQQHVASADARIGDISGEIKALESELESEIARIATAYDPANLPLETETLKPARSNVKADLPALLWLPFDSRGERAW
jgi:hypothetical protein